MGIPRRTLAEKLFTGPRLSIERIADRLGYTELTRFIKAFERW